MGEDDRADEADGNGHHALQVRDGHDVAVAHGGYRDRRPVERRDVADPVVGVGEGGVVMHQPVVLGIDCEESAVKASQQVGGEEKGEHGGGDSY